MARAKSVARSKTSKGLVLLFSVFLLFGCGFCYFMFVRPMWQVWQATGWVETPCTIVSSRVGEHEGEDSTTYSIDITFRYQWDGQPYTSDRYKFTQFSSSGRKSKARVVAKHPNGSKTNCYVDPNAPSVAVINRDFTSDLWFGLIPLVFVVIGACGILGATGVIRFPRPGQAATGVHLTANGELHRGPIELSPASTPGGKLAAAIFVALLWNAIVSVLVVTVIGGHLKGKPDWMLTIFAIPFGIAGLCLIAFVIHRFLGLMTPHPTLRLSQSVIELGEFAAIEWRFHKSTAAFRGFSIKLQGKESVSYQQGTNSYKDEHVFHETVLFESDNQFDSGIVELHIPADTMHTFESDSNQITWLLQVQGNVANWPDVNDSYPILVLPPRG